MILKMENTKKRKRGDFAGDISIIRKKERFSNFSKCWVKEKLVFFGFLTRVTAGSQGLAARISTEPLKFVRFQ